MSTQEDFGAVILAAGKGTRMHSARPKVLHELLGESMLGLVADALRPLCDDRLWSVIGHGAEQVRTSLGERAGRYVLQREQLGTGHALGAAWPALEAAGLEYALVVNGDTPLLESADLAAFARRSLSAGADLAFMSVRLENPGAFGRVLRRAGEVTAVIEAKDYDPALHGPEPREINAGIYFLRLAAVGPLLGKIQNNNKNAEYYITDLIGLGAAAGLKVLGLEQDASPDRVRDFLGVNSPAELVRAEEALRERIARKWLDAGVLLRSPESARIGPKVEIEPGAEICGPCEIYGLSRIAAGVRLDSHCWLRDTSVAAGAKIRSFCHFEGACIGEGCTVGPFARLRPGALLEKEAHVGNFVEMKKSTLGAGAKAGHLSYLGDAEVGPGSNIGAGTITCNYDGANKHPTLIGAGAFIGSNSALVAPVRIGKNALVGAGSVITKDVPDGNLAIARGKQANLPRRLPNPHED